MDDPLRLAAWREYAAWGSLFCGLITLVGSLAIGTLGDPRLDWYLLIAVVIAVLGLILGAIRKDSPRKAGLILSGSMLLILIGCLASV
jgi:hypothetical protein